MDNKQMLGDLDNLPEQDKLRMASMMDQLQLRDSFCSINADDYLLNPSVNPFALLRMYNSLVERCFADCIDNFKRKTLDKQEETCVRRCAEKFLKHTMRVGLRFAELNQGASTTD